MRLELEPDIEVAAEADNASDALRLIRLVHPHVVLMDVEMHGMSGIEATAEIQRLFPNIAVIVLTIYDDPQTRDRALAAGAYALVPKHLVDTCLLSTIRAATGTES